MNVPRILKVMLRKSRKECMEHSGHPPANDAVHRLVDSTGSDIANGRERQNIKSCRHRPLEMVSMVIF